jgi:branched-chain amino acid transport system substrate-binding protein
VGDQDFGPILQRIAKVRPDFLYAPIFVAEAALLTEQVRQTEDMRQTGVGGADGMFTRDWLDAAGPAAEGAYVSAPDYGFWDPRLESEFMPRFERRFGESTRTWPGFIAKAYDATNMVLDAIEDVAIEGSGVLYIPRTRLRDRLFATKNYPGLSGRLTCDVHGDCNHSTPVIIYQVRNGKFRKAWSWRPSA